MRCIKRATPYQPPGEACEPPLTKCCLCALCFIVWRLPGWLHFPGQPPFCPPFSFFFPLSLSLKQAVKKPLALLAPYELLLAGEIGLEKGGKSEQGKVEAAGFAPQSEALQSLIS